MCQVGLPNLCVDHVVIKDVGGALERMHTVILAVELKTEGFFLALLGVQCIQGAVWCKFLLILCRLLAVHMI